MHLWHYVWCRLEQETIFSAWQIWCLYFSSFTSTNKRFLLCRLMQSKIEPIFAKSVQLSPNLLKSSRSCDPTPPLSAIRLSNLTEFWELILEPHVPKSLSTFFPSVCSILSPPIKIQMSLLNIFLVLFSLLLTCHIWWWQAFWGFICAKYSLVGCAPILQRSVRFSHGRRVKTPRQTESAHQNWSEQLITVFWV